MKESQNPKYDTTQETIMRTLKDIEDDFQTAEWASLEENSTYPTIEKRGVGYRIAIGNTTSGIGMSMKCTPNFVGDIYPTIQSAYQYANQIFKNGVLI